MMQCSSCQSENDVDAKYCAACGQVLRLVCLHCGTESNGKFCGQCGKPLQNPVATGQTGSKENHENLGEKLRRVGSYAKLVCEGSKPGCIFTAPMTLANSFSIPAAFQGATLARGEDFEIFKGVESAGSLYQVLYDHNKLGFVIVLDGCDALLHTEAAINILQGVLRPEDASAAFSAPKMPQDRDGDTIPAKFEMVARVIFVSKSPLDELPVVLKSRVLEP